MIGRRLKLARTVAGLSHRGLEDAIGNLVTAQAIGKYERNEWGLYTRVPKSRRRSHDPPPDSHPISATTTTLPTPIPSIHFHSPGNIRDKTTASTTRPAVSQVTFGFVDA